METMLDLPAPTPPQSRMLMVLTPNPSAAGLNVQMVFCNATDSCRKSPPKFNRTGQDWQLYESSAVDVTQHTSCMQAADTTNDITTQHYTWIADMNSDAKHRALLGA